MENKTISKTKIAYIGELDRTPYAPDHLGIRQGLEYFDGIVVDPVLNNESVVAEQIREFNPDIIIHGNTDSLGQGLAQKIKGDWKQVFWMLDYQPDENLYPWEQWDTTGYDAVFISNKDQMDMWGKRFDCPTYYLTHGCFVRELVKDEKSHHPTIFIGSHIDGGWYNNRFQLIEKIKSLIDIHMLNAEGVEGRNNVWKDMPALYHTSDTILDISHTWEADGYASGRYFYSAGLGGCSITRRFPGCEELYPEGTKAYFDTPEEAVELIQYYRDHPRARANMKKRAWKWNMENHHYKLKFKEICTQVIETG